MQNNQIKSFQEMIKARSTKDPSPISGHTLQKLIGILALTLPTILIIGAAVAADCQFVQNSISAYYHTVMRDIFVGILCGVGIGMLAYKGYHPMEGIIANIAAICAFGVALFPTSVGIPTTDCIGQVIDKGIYNTLHFASAAILFLILAFFSLVLFTIKGSSVSKKKIWRNKIYTICGWIIIGCILFIALYAFLAKGKYPSLDKARPVFFLEALALTAFSVSWMVKGEMILKD